MIVPSDQPNITKEEAKARYPWQAADFDCCWNCKYLNVGLLEERCSHPPETYQGYPSCFTEVSIGKLRESFENGEDLFISKHGLQAHIYPILDEAKKEFPDYIIFDKIPYLAHQSWTLDQKNEFLKTERDKWFEKWFGE